MVDRVVLRSLVDILVVKQPAKYLKRVKEKEQESVKVEIQRAEIVNAGFPNTDRIGLRGVSK